MSDWLTGGDQGTAPLDVVTMLLGLLLAFLGGQLIAWVYMWTHAGLSYSRSFVNSLVLIPVIVALVMFVLANNLVTAFGLMAVFAIVRFRNILRDTMDTAYVLAIIVIGMACGTQKFSSAIVGTVVMGIILAYLRFTGFGTRHRYDLIVNLHWGRSQGDLTELDRLLARHSFQTQCASQRSSESSEGTELSYRLLLRDSGRVGDLLSEMRALPGVSRVNSLKAEDESEL
jgi:uncharacterized membrane protein YhiD involved in acid resistance